MITATYTISAADVLRVTLLRYETSAVIMGYFRHYLFQFSLLAVTAILLGYAVGTVMNAGVLLVATAIVSLGYALRDRRAWIRRLRAWAKGYTLTVSLDEDGVVVRRDSDPVETAASKWDDYLWLDDDAERVIIRHRDGIYSCIPKNPATAEVIAFTRSKIRSREAFRKTAPAAP